MLIGSSDGNGNADVTPKGDRPGFVAVLDDITLAIPDRPGNNRLDTLENIIANPAGRAALPHSRHERDAARQRRGAHHRGCGLARAAAAEGKLPATVIVVEVKAVYMHCAKAFMRSELWSPESWPDRAKLPTLGQYPQGSDRLADSAEATDRWLDEAYQKSMW